MFKKTLIAAALATTALGAAASTVSVDEASVGVEYAKATETFVAGTINITPQRNYNEGDIITLIVGGANLVTTDADGDAVAIEVNGEGELADKVEFLEYKDNTVRVLVTAPAATETVAGAILLGNVTVDISNATDGGKVTFSAKGRVGTVDGPIDVDSSAAVTFIEFDTEYMTAVAEKFDAVIDVNAARKAFSTEDGGADDADSDTLVLEHTRVTPADGATMATEVVYTVEGDFSFLDADGDDELGGDDDGSVTAPVGTVVVADDFMSVTITDTSGATFATSGTFGITVNAPADMVIPDQSFTASVEVEYTADGGTTTDTKTTLDEADAGSWTLNGAKAHIPFLPYGSNFAQAVTVSNTSSQTGGVDLVIYAGDEVIEMESIATINAQGVTNLSAALRDAVANAGITTGNLAFDLIINAPDSAITVEALYFAKSDADRLRTL